MLLWHAVLRQPRIGLRVLAAGLAVASCAECSVDPVKALKRQAIGMRPRLLESCLPEASAVEIEGDVERLTYTWTLDERGADRLGEGLESVSSFQSSTTAAPSGACKVLVEIDAGVVQKVELGEPEASAVDATCASRVRACLAAPKTSDAR